MDRRRKRPFPKRTAGTLLLLILLALLLPLSGYLAGILPGGRGDDLGDSEEPATGDGTLKITVLATRDGNPVTGARILVRDLDGGTKRAVSDDQGEAAVAGLRPGPVHVAATLGGKSGGRWHDPAASPSVLVLVGRDEARRGTVRHADGRPADATVRLVSADGVELHATTTDDQGRYELPADPRAASVCAEPRDGPPAAAVAGDLVIEKGVDLSGQLAGAGGGALEIYAVVVAPGTDRPLLVRATWPVAEDGSFGGSLPEGSDAWAMYGGLPLRLAGGSQSLPDLVPLRGSVQRADGSPAAKARLLFRPLVDADFPPPLPALEIRAGEDGAFARKDFPRLRYTVEASAEGCATQIFPEVAVDREPLRLTLQRGYVLFGSVVDDAGVPVPGARVDAIGLPDPEAARPRLRARADASGRFRFAGLGGRHARVRVSAAGFHATTMDGVRPHTELRVALQRVR